jgi:hypothetical protein
MKSTRKTGRPPSAESIARCADQGKDISSFFTNSGPMRIPADANRRKRGKWRQDILRAFELAASDLGNVSEEGILKTIHEYRLEKEKRFKIGAKRRKV